jgi:hypothetical protein
MILDLTKKKENRWKENRRKEERENFDLIISPGRSGILLWPPKLRGR